MVTLNRLTESLNKLYESNNLTEAFDESFPKWLKDRLITVRKYHEPGGYRSVSWQDRPEYINARSGDDAYNSESNMSLFNKALAKGIDFTNTKVIEGPIPEKRTDERLKDPNIPIWLFSNGQVYIDGINDNELYKATGKAFKYMPMKDKIANAKAFAYIDSSKIDSNIINKKRGDRATLRQELANIPNYTRRGTKDYDKFAGWTSYGTPFDKSGYAIVNPERYKKEIEKLSGKKIYQELEKYYNNIVDAKRKVMDAYAVQDTFSTNSRTIRSIMDYIDDAVSSYNSYMRNVNNIVDSTYSEDYKAKELGRIVSNIRNDYSMRRINDYGAEVFLSDIDWD